MFYGNAREIILYCFALHQLVENYEHNSTHQLCCVYRTLVGNKLMYSNPSNGYF